MELLLPGGTLLALLMWLSSGVGRGQFGEPHSSARSPAQIERVVAVKGDVVVTPAARLPVF
jgi:hypothetical protein